MKNNYKRLKMVAYVFVAVLLAILAFSAKAKAAPIKYTLQKEIEISGTVDDENGVPVSGATIALEGLNRGTITDMDGNFTLFAPSNAVLVISYLGYTTQKISIENKKELKIILEEDVDALGEVKINAGYYNTTERERTGNISKVKGEEIELQPVVSPLQALQGRMAGVEISARGNLPGQASTIRIRGTNSLRTEGNYPLYIIDGVPISSTPIGSRSIVGSGIDGFDPLNSLNLSNIESIEVLKDADATAIYGSRGANGVVLITTKSGIQKGMSLETSVYTGASRIPNKMEMLNTEEYLQIRRQAFDNDGVEPSQFNAYDLVLWDQDRYTDWQDFYYGGTAPITDVNLNASGGNATTSFRIGGGYHNQGSIYPGDYNYNKLTTNLNLNHHTNDERFGINLSVNYGIDKNILAGSTDVSSAPFSLPPNAPRIFNPDGSLHWDEWNDAGQNNPMAGFFNHSETQIKSLISSLALNYQLSDGLNIKLNGGFTNLNSKELVKIPQRSFNPAWNFEDQSQHLDIERRSWLIEPQLTYHTTLWEGELDAIIGATFQQNRDTNLELLGTGYVSEAVLGNLNAAESVKSMMHINSQYNYNAFFGRLAYNWRSKYFINLTGRRDGSSRFGPGKQFANFGAIGAAWIFTEEPLIENILPFLSFGKLRGSYGTTGSDQIGDYGYLEAYDVTPGPGGLYPTQLFNPQYSWEINKKLEAGIQIGFFNDRMSLGASWYRNRSSNQLVGFPLPGMTGFTSVQANLPATVENAGWEIELTSLWMKRKNFRWRTSFNLSIPENRLINYPDLENSPYANRYRVGEPLNIKLLYRLRGLDPDTGFYAMEDINEDGRIDFSDRVDIKDLGRQYFGGINNSLSHKNFRLDFHWEFVKQEGRLLNMDAGRIGNQRIEALKTLDNSSRYQIPSQSIQALLGYIKAQATPLFYTDASFLRLRTVSVGYDLPMQTLKNIGLEKATLSLHGQNLITITGYDGVDPEIATSGNSFGALRSLTGGIKLNF
ncbi:SusC/RagA family TonB-linked outer membrane protein [Salegentibacter sp. F14]